MRVSEHISYLIRTWNIQWSSGAHLLKTIWGYLFVRIGVEKFTVVLTKAVTLVFSPKDVIIMRSLLFFFSLWFPQRDERNELNSLNTGPMHEKALVMTDFCFYDFYQTLPNRRCDSQLQCALPTYNKLHSKQFEVLLLSQCIVIGSSIVTPMSSGN